MPDGTPSLEEQIAANQSTSAAAPAGLQQQAQAGASDSSLAAQIQDQGYVPTATSWYTGANTQGTENGWDTDFSQKFVEGANAATEAGTLDSYFESKDGTGVVLWDHTSANGTPMNFGDIYVDGRKEGNVYKQFDQDTADLMLADWMFDGDEKAALYSQSDPMAALHTAVEDRRKEDTEGWQASLDLKEFNSDVATNTEAYQEGGGDTTTVIGGALGGAALGAGGGAAVGAFGAGVGAVPGAIVGGIGGFITGGVGAFLNQDAIAEAAGRAYTITSMSREEFGLPAAIGTGVEQWAGVGAKTITPFGNLVEGGFDALHGDVGDGISEFYRIDETTGGESQVNGWWKTAHLTAAVADAGLQFASPIGAGLFATQMTAQIGGQIGGLIGSGGNTFDYNTAQFDNIFTDDQGNFDPVSAAAGIGKVGIDAVQLGFARGLGAKVDSALIGAGEAGVYKTGLSGAFSKLTPWRVGRSEEGVAALAAGAKPEIVAGQEFIKDAAGNVVSRRATIGLLAPSEQIMYFSSRVRALRQASVREGRAVEMDDFYAAAKSLAEGENRASMVLVNAFGEGYEEAVQGVLEPWSHDHAIDWNSLATSFAYGAAMGGGMAGSAAARMPTANDRDYSLAAFAHQASGQGTLSRKTWNEASPMERQNWLAMGGMEMEQLRAAHTRVQQDQTADHTATVAGVDKLNDAARKKQAAEAKKAIGSNPDAAITIVALDDATHRADVVTSSSVQLDRNLASRIRGFALQGQTLDRELKDAQAAQAADPTNEQLVADVAQLESALDKVELSIKWGQELQKVVAQHLGDVEGETDFSLIDAHAAAINDILAAAFDRELNQMGGVALSAEDKMALAKVVSQVKTRDPQDANRSYQVLLPQVDSMFTMWGADNVVGISQTILPAIRGDYDGDKVRDQTQLMLDDEAFTTARAGGHFIGAGREVNVAATKTEKEIYRKIADALSLHSQAGLHIEAVAVMTGIGYELKKRYDGVLDLQELEGAIKQFFTALQSGADADARAVLVSALANLDSAGALTKFSRDRLSNEWLWVSTLVQRRLQEFQRVYASHTPRDGSFATTGADIVRRAARASEGIEGVQIEPLSALGLRDAPILLDPDEAPESLNAGGARTGLHGERLAIRVDGQIKGYADYWVTTDNEGLTTAHTSKVYIREDGQSRGAYSAVQNYLGDSYDFVDHGDMTDAGAQALAKYARRHPDRMEGHKTSGKLGGGEDFSAAEENRVVEQLALTVDTRPERAVIERQATDVGGRRPLSPQTDGQLMAMLLPGDSIFRMFQQLHYRLTGSRDIAAVDQGDSSVLSAMAQLYEALSSMVTRDILAEIRGKDEINARVVAMMKILAADAKDKHPALNSAKAMALVANMRVLDFEYDDEGNPQPGDGGEITMTQFLLKQSLYQWQREKAAIFDASPELQAKFTRLMGLTRAPKQGRKGSKTANAERAFVEVFGAQQLYTLLGEDAESLGQHLTVEQYVRKLTNMPHDQRKSHIASLHQDSNYRDGEEASLKPITPPYDLVDIEDPDIQSATAFRSVVDSMVSTSRARVSLSGDKVIGEIADDSADVSKRLWAAHSEIRRILEEYLEVRGGGVLNVESLKLMLTSEPKLARRVYDLIPDSAANLALPVDPTTGQVRVANWVYDMLTESDPQVAEMIYYRNLVLLEYDAVRLDNLDPEGEYGDVAKLKFGDLKRRIHQVMWELRNNGDGGVQYSLFLVELEKSGNTVDNFLKWVNGHPEVLGERAPIVAWHDDVAEFDQDKANGGWMEVLSGTELRVAINALQTTAKSISVVREVGLSREDADLLSSIKRYLDPAQTHTTHDETNYKQLEQRLVESGRRMVGLGPSAMFYQVVAAARGFYGKAHAKGKAPAHLEAAAAFDAVRDQFGYLTNLGRLMATLTSHTMNAVDGTIGLTARTAGRSMDENGNPIAWDQVSVEQWVELMDNPDSRKLARSIVSAQVLDRDEDGILRVKALHGPSIQALLDGTSYRDLFVKGEDVTNFDMDLRYLSAVEAEAARFGGHFAVQRALNDLVIARISSAKSKLSAEEIEKLTVEAMRDAATILRTVAAAPAVVDTEGNVMGADPLEALHKAILEERRATVNGRQLELGDADGTLTQVAFEVAATNKEIELEETLQELLAESEMDPSPERAAEIAAKISSHKRAMERWRERHQQLMTDNFAGTVVEMFAVPDVEADMDGNAAAKRALIEYVLANPTIRAKVPETLKIANKILSHANSWEYDGTMDNISAKEWDTLSRAAIAMYIDTALSVSAPSATISPIPDAEAGFQDRMKYYDHTFGYLADPFMDGASPLLKAARAIQAQSGRLSVQASDSQVIEVLERRLFKDFSLGSWNSDIPKFSIEAGEGLDSASGVPAVSLFGDLVKREEAFAAAKHRTYDVPPEGTASRVSLNWAQLEDGTLYNDVEVVHPTGPVARPLVQLNNRFATAVAASYMDNEGNEVTVDLLQPEHHVGRPFAAVDSAAEAGPLEVHLERIRHAIERVADRAGVPAAAIRVDMEFYHPDMKPAQPGWYNNLFFEGTSFALDADTSASLPATLNFFEGAQNPVGQGRALDSRKQGVPGLHHVDLPTHDEVLAIESNFTTDLSYVIRAKAKLIMGTELDGGHIEPEYYNAVYANLMLRHFVDHVVDGQTVRWTAEQVIEHQLRGGELVNAKLWLPPDDVLRSMLGDTGTGGVRKLTEDLSVDIGAVKQWAGITAPMLERFPVDTVDRRLQDTELVNRASLRQLQARARLSDVERAQYDLRLKRRQQLQAQGRAQRGQLPVRESGFSARRNLERFQEAAKKAIRAEDVALSAQRAGVSFVGDRNPHTLEQSVAVVDATVSNMPTNTAGFIYRHSWNDAPIDHSFEDGVLTQVAFSQAAPDGMQALPGDVVLIDLATFRGDRDLAMKVIDHFADRGLIIVVGEDSGRSDFRAEMSNYIESLPYERLANSAHVYEPSDLKPRYRHGQALASGLVSWGGISKRSRLGIFLTEDLDVEENTMWVDPDNPHLNAIAETVDVVQSDVYGGFNVPTPAQVDETRRRILTLDTTEGRELLLQQSLGHLKGAQRKKAEERFREAWADLIDRVQRQTDTLLPKPGDEFGTGDIIPLVDGHNRIVFYRHGHEAPAAPELEDMLRQPLTEKKIDSANVAIYSGKRDANATSHRGEVVEFNPYSHFGLSVRLNIELQVLGDKKLLEWNGFKALLTWRPKRIKLPQRDGKTLPLFANGFSVDGIASMHDAVSKHSFKDILNNHRVAFWLFGVDFLPDVAEFLGVSEHDARQLLEAVTKLPKISIEDAHYINTQGRASTEMLRAFEQLSGVSLAKLEAPDSVGAQITLALMTYLMTQGAETRAVLRSGSFADPSADPNNESVEMPELFTEAFDLAPINSPLRVELNRRFNLVLEKNQDGTGYVLHPDFRLEVVNPDTGDSLQGFLQIPIAHSSGDNPVFNGQSYDPDQKSAYSLHSAAMVYQAMAGTRTALPRDLTRGTEFLSAKAVRQRDAALREDGGVYHMLTGFTRDDAAKSAGWRADTPMEVIYKRLATEAMVQFRQPLDTSSWSEEDVVKYEKRRRDIVAALGLKRTQVELVDYWVRQMGGRWKDLGEPSNQDELTAKAALEYSKDVLDNVLAGYLPTAAAEVPALSVYDLQLIFRANRKSRKWAPRESLDNKSKARAGFDDWDAWTSIALGSILTADHLFSPIYLAALDGFFQTYKFAGSGLTDLPVSMDIVRAVGLLDPDNNRMLMSLSPQKNRILQEAPLLDATRVTLEDILGGQSISGKFRSDAAPTSEIAKRRNARREWAKKNDVPLAVDVSLKDLKRNGMRLKAEGSNTSALMRILINLRVGTALLNPLLYISMGPEQWTRGSLERITLLLSGQSTTGRLSRLAARAGASTYTVEEMKDLDKLYEKMGNDIPFKYSIYEALDFLNPVQSGNGRITRFTEKYARMGALAQDPTRGMSAKTMAKRYTEAVLRTISSDPQKYRVTRQYVADKLREDSMWVEKNMHDVHVMASNNVAQIRSLKSTPLSLMVRGIYEPFSESNHAGVNFFGNLLLKMPLIFSTYAMNVLVNITGMGGFSDIVAASVQGRKAGPGNIFYRIQQGIKGESVDENHRIGMSEVMEGIDLSHAFIRGGVTHTALFALGMAAGNLGLSGEDDETKKRRKLAALYGLHPVLDPRRLENDYRNKDAIFLDWLPLGLDHFFDIPVYGEDGEMQSMAQLPWIMRQFISPVIGMEQFFETGDFDNVTRGFADAVGAFPLINTGMWADAVETAHTLQTMAKEQEEIGQDENLTGAYWFLTNAVGLYEKMLVENSFVNEFYVAMDRYDRNPYILPLRDSDGELQRDIEGNTRPNNLGLESYIDDQGNVAQGYQTRDAGSATLHALTENRGTLAFVTSLFTGGPADSDFFRYNMPQKTYTQDADMATQSEAEAVIRAAMEGAARQGDVLENVSYEEILGKLKSDYAEAGNWDGYNQVDVEAKRIYKQQNHAPAALSVLNPRGEEVLTEDGAFAVLRGLRMGLVQLGDQSLSGIHITFEMREAIQKDWMAELKQEGLDMGLDETAAMKRVNRLWYGPTEDPTIPGIKDYVWSDELSYDQTVTYKQLNTTYVMGPDGRPAATGFRRDNLFNLTGVLPLNAAFISEQGATSQDARLNTVDLVNGTNTGMRALELVDKSSYVPTDKEIGDSIVKAIEALDSGTQTPFTPYKSNGSSGYGGGSGGYSGGGTPYFSKMYAPAAGATPYGHPVSSINTSNPYIRRASIRRERVWSERGRLKQWQ